MGWSYDDLEALPSDVYRVLIEWLTEEAESRKRTKG
jgi:hypothetical protein